MSCFPRSMFKLMVATNHWKDVDSKVLGVLIEATHAALRDSFSSPNRTQASRVAHEPRASCFARVSVDAVGSPLGPDLVRRGAGGRHHGCGALPDAPRKRAPRRKRDGGLWGDRGDPGGKSGVVKGSGGSFGGFPLLKTIFVSISLIAGNMLYFFERA